MTLTFGVIPVLMACKPRYLEKLKRAGVNWLGLGIGILTLNLHQYSQGRIAEVSVTDLIGQVRNAGITLVETTYLVFHLTQTKL